MCLLTFMPYNIDIDYERARISAKANPDGFGFAIHAGIAIIKDHDMDFEKLWTRWSDLRKMYKGPAMFHFRIATHGSLNIDNCHPFNVGDNAKSVLGHNGILPLTMPINDNRSDTKLFAEIVLPHIGGVKTLDDDEKFKEIAEWANGNKLVILTVDEETKNDWYIVNEHLGHWKDDMWWSNSSYVRHYPTAYVNYPSSPYVGKTYSGYNYRNDDEFDEDWVRESYAAKNKEEEAWLDRINWTKSDQWEFIEDELYPDLEILNKVRTFTDFSQMDVATITCYNCASVFVADPLEPSPTHCGECKACLNCSSTKKSPDDCHCWDGYEYGQSYVFYEEKMQSETLWDEQS